MIGPPFRKLSTKKFLSNALSGAAGVAAGATLATGEAIAVVVAGDIAAVAGVMPGAGEIPGTAGLMAVTGGAPAGLAGDVPGGGWPNEVDATVTEQSVAISSVFIGLIGKFFPGSDSDKDFPLVYPQ